MNEAEYEKRLAEDPRWQRWLKGEFTEEEWARLEKGERPPFVETP